MQASIDELLTVFDRQSRGLVLQGLVFRVFGLRVPGWGGVV